ncbi:MAG TPA: DUF3426 domain-containing protein [Hydrogenophaga sp.]
MSFTTRCPACGTMFKVVPDQLKISDGWVRCGHCSDVFDAMLNLQESVAPAAPEKRSDSAPSGAAKASAHVETGAARVVIRRTPIPAPPPPAPKPPPPAPAVQAPAVQTPAAVVAAPPAFAATVPMPLEIPASVAAPRTDEVLPSHAEGGASASLPGGRSLREAVLPEDESALLLGAGEGDADQWDDDWLLSPSNISRHREAVEQELRTQAMKGPPVPRKPQPVDPEFERDLGAFAGMTRAPGAPSAQVQAPEARCPAPLPIPAQTPTTPPQAAAVVEAPIKRSTFGPSEPPEAADSQWAMSQLEADDPDSGFGGEPPEPTFVVQARREAFWRKPAMRGLLFLVAIGLGALLGLQWVSFDRDQLAARYPELEPALKMLCSATGCSLAAPRRIDAVAIDSSTLTRKLGQFYSFDLVVKNNEPMAVAMPALELSLTDSRDKEIARRVFLPQELPGTPKVVPPKGSLSVSMQLSLSESDLVNMAGYRALVFYP